MDIAIRPGGKGCRHPRRLAGRQAHGHDTDAAVDKAIGGDGTSGDEHIPQSLRQQATIRDAVRLPGLIVLKAGHPMQCPGIERGDLPRG